MSGVSASDLDADRVASLPSRSELFGLCSLLFRVCTYQHMALRSLRDPETDDFGTEMEKASKELDTLYSELNDFIGFKPS